MARDALGVNMALILEDPAALCIPAETAEEVYVRARVDEQVEDAVAVPVMKNEGAAAAGALGRAVELQRPALLVLRNAVLVVFRDVLAVKDALAGQQLEFAVGRAAALVEREISLVIKGDEIHQPILIPVHEARRATPMGDERPALRLPPIPRRLRRGARPGDFDGLAGGELEIGLRAGVAVPNVAAPDVADDQIDHAVAVPVAGADIGVAPFRLARAERRAVRARLRADDFSAGGDINGRSPTRRVAPNVLDKANVTGRVAGHEVLKAVAVEIDGVRRGDGTEFHVLRLLAKITRLQKLRHAVHHASGVLDQRHAAVLVADDKVRMTVAIEVIRH